MERVFTKGTVLADPLDVQETSIGLKADIRRKAGRFDSRFRCRSRGGH